MTTIQIPAKFGGAPLKGCRLKGSPIVDAVLCSRWTPVALLSIAIVERTAWSFIRPGQALAGEAQNVALAIARGAGFADAYFVGSGPTAHLLPTTPLLAGMILAIFGSQSLAANLILAAWAILQMVVNFILLFRLFEKLGSPRISRLAALAILCCVPIFLGQENLDFRYWEGGVSLMSCLISLHLILRLHSIPIIQKADIISMALLTSLTFILNPIVGLGVYLASFFLLTRRFSLRASISPVLISAGCLILLLSPWVIRNHLVMGHAIVLRDNLGLELSIANNDATAANADHDSWANHANVLHPSGGGQGRTRVLEVGEYAYLAELQRDADDWIVNHPGEFARLCLRHLRQMYFPDAWQFEFGSGKYSTARAAIYGILSAVGLLGLVAGLLRDPLHWRYVAAIVFAVGLLYMPFQPITRYLYLIHGLLAFCAADFVFRTVALLKSTHSTA